MSAERLHGVLIKWDATKGYGFIKVVGSNRDYFLHNRLIKTEHRPSVAVGRSLSFVPMATKRGLEAWAPSLIHDGSKERSNCMTAMRATVTE